MLRRSLRAPALVVLSTLFLALPACDELTGDEGGNEEEPQHDAALVGEWVAISALYTNPANASQSFDGILEGGGFTLVVFDADGTAALTEYDTEAEQMEEGAGTWATESGGRLIVNWAGDPGPDTVGYQVTGGYAVIDLGEEDFDWNGDGMDEVANFVFTFADLSNSPDADLVGAWEATAMVFTSVADPGTSVDVIQYGATFSLDVNADGTYTVVIVEPADPNPITDTETGLFTALDGVLWAYETATQYMTVLAYDVDGNTATLTHGMDEEFDFDDDGIDEPAIMTLTLARQ